MMSLDKASNAIVATVGFYADALATAAYDREQTLAVLKSSKDALESVATQLSVTMELLKQADDLIGGLVSGLRNPMDGTDKDWIDDIVRMSNDWHERIQKLTVVNVPKAPR